MLHIYAHREREHGSRLTRELVAPTSAVAAVFVDNDDDMGFSRFTLEAVNKVRKVEGHRLTGKP